jgi:HAD superfamily hydrolase (TIGR01509 family)
MTMVIAAIIVGTAFLALYWVFYGQRKYNDMFMPKRKTKLKAVLFDLDGVILDSFDAWFGVFNDVRKNFRLKEISKDEFKSKVWGGSVHADVKKYYKDKNVEEIEKIYKSLILKHVHETKLLPGAVKVLKNIKENKIKIGLVTNSFRKPVLKMLGFHKIRDYFDAVVTSEDVERAKPYPDPIIRLCEKLEVMPDEAILVGDTKNDYKAGKAAGCLVIGLNTNGDLIISQLNDLLELV